MKFKLFLLIDVLLLFGAYSTYVVLTEGYTGFITLAMAEAWGMQVLLDLTIALVLFATWMFADAKREGISAVPYFVAMLFLGSIGALGYLIHRTAKQLRAEAGPRAALA